MSSKIVGAGDLHVQLLAKDVRVTDSIAPVPNFVLAWMNRSKELVSIDIHMSDFYNEGLFASVDANFVFGNMTEFLEWYNLEKTRDAMASLRELAKQRRVDLIVSTRRPEPVSGVKSTNGHAKAQNGNGSAKDASGPDEVGRSKYF